jgi:GNAT superfamily N-acetyltransferase
VDPTEWVIELGDVQSEESRALLLEYYTEVSDRWHRLHDGRDTTEAELEAGFPRMRSDGLAPPTGVFLVARSGDGADLGTVLGGCAGLQRSRSASGERVGEVRRMYVRPALRGSGLAPSLLACVEEVARAWGLAEVRLDTRRDLLEALSLYRRNGWVDVPPFSDHPYAEVWLAKRLD